MNKSGDFFKDSLVESENTQVSMEYAIYDNGNVKSVNNKLAAKIAQNQLLNEDERETLLRTHEAGLLNITSVLENEKKH
jgi:hypothetical protein